MTAVPGNKTYRMDLSPEDDSQMNIDNSDMVINKMATLYAEKIMSDIVLVVGNTEYPSHRLILCASSDVFQIMLHGSQWSESRETRIHLGETPSCAAVFEDFLKYLYTGKIHLDFATVVPIVSLADKYNVKDLLRLGLDYMERNISTACKKNQVVSWYQLTLASGHMRVADMCRDFIKSNFETVSRTIDFPNMEPDVLVALIECNDLVVEDELRLFECVSRWLAAKRSAMEASGEENVDVHFDRYVRLVVPHVRFAMMSSSQFAQLLLHPVSKSHTDLVVAKIRDGMNFHRGVVDADAGRRPYTPRLYTTEKFCASLTIGHVRELPAYHACSLVFSSQRGVAEHEGDGQVDWAVDIYPRGVCFQRCLTVYQPSGKEVPERVIRTVRVSLTSKERDETLRVKIGILVVGSQDNFEHIRCVRTRNYVFSPDDQIVNFDDLVDHDELTCDKQRSHFLSGENRESLKILIVIAPLSKHSSLCQS